MQGAFWQKVRRLRQRWTHLNAETRVLIAGLAGGMAAFVAHGLVDEGYYLIDLTFIFFMALGLMHQMSAESDQKKDE